MKILIIEDETPALNRLMKLVNQVDPTIEIIGTADSVEGAVKMIQEHPEAELALMDIELADGQSFEIFGLTEVKIPVIFTTAYDEFALKAFKVNSIDYLLKPIDKAELERAIDKYKQRFKKGGQPEQLLSELLLKINSAREFKERFLVKHGQRLLSVPSADIAYFFAQDKLVYLNTKQGNRYVVDFTLEELTQQLDPKFFFQLNRKFLVALESIGNIHTYFNGKLKITLIPSTEDEVMVSRERASDFKTWLGN